MPLAVTGIDHVQIAVPRMKVTECVAFYREIFGFPEMPNRKNCASEGARGFKSAVFSCMWASTPDHRRRASVISAFSSLGLARAKDEIITGGICTDEESVADGLSRFFIRDPTGNRLEIGQHP